MKIISSRHSNRKLLFGWLTVKQTGSTLAIFDWFDWWTNQMYFTLTFLPVTCHMSFTSSFRYQRRRSVLQKICAILFSLYWSVFRPLCLKMNERRYLEVVSGSCKFIFAVSTGYLFGICCNLCASVFTWPRAIVCLSESSESESELLCKKQKAKSLGFWVKWCQFITFSEMVSNYM